MERVCGTGSYVPAHVMANDDLARIVDTNDEWIRERTGIGRRHVIGEETTSYMAGRAARQCAGAERDRSGRDRHDPAGHVFFGNRISVRGLRGAEDDRRENTRRDTI